MNDQKVKSDSGKPRLTLVPRRIIFAIAKIREYGNAKYPEGGPDNWKQVEKERYRDAAYRHFMAYLDDPAGRDQESGISHLAHLACNIAFLCEMEKQRRSFLIDRATQLLLDKLDPGYIRPTEDGGWEWLDHPDGQVCIEWNPAEGYIFHGNMEELGNDN